MQPVAQVRQGGNGTAGVSKTKTNAKQGTVKFICGGRETSVATAVGRTPSALRGELKTKLNLTKAHDTVYVNGESVNAKTHKLQAGDEVEFLREAGEKG